MKTTCMILFAAAALTVPAAAFATSPDAPKATATVEFDRPENFTDFSLSNFGRASDAEFLAAELRREINRLAGSILPAGYRVMMRFDDIDLAGEFEPQRRPPNDQVRIMRAVYTPKLHLTFSVTDSAGNVVASGDRRLTDLNYESRLRLPNHSQIQIEAELIGDFFREIRRSTT